MKKTVSLIMCSAFLFLFMTGTHAQNLSGLDTVQSAIERSGIPKEQVSIYVQAVDADKPLMAQNATKLQNPASLMKLVTSYAAFKTLGVNHQWETSLLSEGVPDAQGVLHQPLYLKGSGDPQLVVEQVALLFDGLKQSRVKEFNSALMVDRSIFNADKQAAEDFDGSPTSPYNAQADAALMNYHALSILFDPALKKVTMTPSLMNYPLANRVQWLEEACPVQGWKNSIVVNMDVSGVFLSGSYYRGCGLQQLNLHPHLLSNNDYAYGLVGNLLAKQDELTWRLNQSAVVMAVQDGLVPKKAKVLAFVRSNPLPLVLKDMNYFSNNVMARQVYLALSVKVFGVGSLEGSAKVVNRVLQAQGIKTQGLNVDNGSGLSRVATVRAVDLGQLLVAAASDTLLYDSLPVVGVSGTVKNRLKDTDMVGRGHIKTGTLNDVRGIAGYIDGKSGTRYAVVSIIQGARAQTAEGRMLHDALMQWMGEQ